MLIQIAFIEILFKNLSIIFISFFALSFYFALRKKYDAQNKTYLIISFLSIHFFIKICSMCFYSNSKVCIMFISVCENMCIIIIIEFMLCSSSTIIIFVIISTYYEFSGLFSLPLHFFNVCYVVTKVFKYFHLSHMLVLLFPILFSTTHVTQINHAIYH